MPRRRCRKLQWRPRHRPVAARRERKWRQPPFLPTLANRPGASTARRRPMPRAWTTVFTHEPGEDRFTSCQRVTHDLRVEDRLQRDGDEDHPEQRETMLDEGCRPEKELPAADRNAQSDHTRSDRRHPSESSWPRRLRQFSRLPCIESRPSLEWRRRRRCQGRGL